MEISPVKYDQLMLRREETLARDAVSPQKAVNEEISNEQVKGSTSLQKELLSIMSAAQETRAQETAKKQIDAGYLDIKV